MRFCVFRFCFCIVICEVVCCSLTFLSSVRKCSFLFILILSMWPTMSGCCICKNTCESAPCLREHTWKTQVKARCFSHKLFSESSTKLVKTIKYGFLDSSKQSLRFHPSSDACINVYWLTYLITNTQFWTNV